MLQNNDYFYPKKSNYVGSPMSCAFASVRARIGVRSFTSRNLRNSGPQSVCRQSPMSCAFASVRARIGVRSFTSRNLRNSGPQSLCQVLSHVPSPTHARIGVSTFTSRNLRDRFRSGNIVISMIFALPLVFCSRSTGRVEKKHILCRHSTLYMYHHPVYARKVLRHVPSSCQSLVKPSSNSGNSQKKRFFLYFGRRLC